MAKALWVETYRPSTVSEYVFQNESQKKQVVTWIKEKSIPHVIFSGSAGTGKTSMAKMLIHEIGIEEFDVLEINASRTNSVDDVRDKITNFVSMIPFGPFKVVLLDEADYLSVAAQAALRGVMEQYSATARFILTCNFPQRIIPALHSRCQGFHITTVDQTEFTARAATVLVTENIDFDLDTLDTYVKATYPDLRKCINTLQQNSIDSKLSMPTQSTSSTADWKIDLVQFFKDGNIKGARKLVCGSVRPEEIEEIYVWLYRNLDLISDDDEVKDQALLIIKQGLCDHTIIADPEINLAAVFVKLSRLK